MTLIHLQEEKSAPWIRPCDQTLRSDTVMRPLCFPVLVAVAHCAFPTPPFLHISFSCVTRRLRWTGDVSAAERALFSEMLFGLIGSRLDAVGSTIQPNCSFNILCLFFKIAERQECFIRGGDSMRRGK